MNKNQNDTDLSEYPIIHLKGEDNITPKTKMVDSMYSTQKSLKSRNTIRQVYSKVKIGLKEKRKMISDAISGNLNSHYTSWPKIKSLRNDKANLKKSLKDNSTDMIWLNSKLDPIIHSSSVRDAPSSNPKQRNSERKVYRFNYFKCIS